MLLDRFYKQKNLGQTKKNSRVAPGLFIFCKTYPIAPYFQAPDLLKLNSQLDF